MFMRLILLIVSIAISVAAAPVPSSAASLATREYNLLNTRAEGIEARGSTGGALGRTGAGNAINLGSKVAPGGRGGRVNKARSTGGALGKSGAGNAINLGSKVAPGGRGGRVN